MKTVLKLLFVSASLLGFTQHSNAQPAVTVETRNTVQTTPNKFTFEVYVKNTGTANWAYATAQYGIKFNPDIINSGVLSVKILASGLPDAQKPPAALLSKSRDRIRITLNTITEGGPWIKVGEEKLVARIEVTNTVNFPAVAPNLTLRNKNPDRVLVSSYNSGNTGTAAAFATVTLVNDTKQPQFHK